MKKAEENLGMAMIFTIISAVQERLTDMMERAAKEEEEEAERKKIEHEEAERVSAQYWWFHTHY